MYSLIEVSGLPISFDEEQQAILIDSNLLCHECCKVSLAEIVPTLLNKSLRYPEHVYTLHRQVVQKDHLSRKVWPEGISYDLYFLPHSLLGIEYVKTHIYQTPEHLDKVACIVEVLLGELTIVMQKNQPKQTFDFDTHVAEAITLVVSSGERAVIPTGYMFTFVNATFASVVFSVVWTTEFRIDYRQIEREQGLAYFLIAKNARTEIVANPRYRSKPQVKVQRPNDVPAIPKAELPSEPLYQYVLNSLSNLQEVLL